MISPGVATSSPPNFLNSLCSHHQNPRSHKLAQQVVIELQQRYQTERLGVLGSYVRGEQNKNSDMDVLVEFFEPVGFFTFLGLEEYLENLLGVNVDLVTKNALKPGIKKRILGEVLYV